MKTLSFKPFKAASESSSTTKRANQSKDTKHEKVLRKLLWAKGLRYRIHEKSIVGKPDIVFRKAKLIVFCDGDFWHGRNWKQLRIQLAGRHNPAYWLPKIHGNIKRDKEINKILALDEWKVLRFWESDIMKGSEGIANIIQIAVSDRLTEFALDTID